MVSCIAGRWVLPVEPQGRPNMVRHADTEMTVMKKGIFILTNP